MGKQKPGSQRAVATPNSHRTRGGDADDEFQPASLRSDSPVRETMARRKSHHAKDQMSKGVVNKFETLASKRKIQEQGREGRQKDREARQLVRWSPYMDQRLLLIMVYELKKMAIKIPWDDISRRMSKERKTTAQSVTQHLTKLRVRMLNQGCWVPPLNGRTNVAKLPDIRGVVQVQDKNGDLVEKALGWEDDLSKYTEPVDIDGDLRDMAASIPIDRLNPTGRSAGERKATAVHCYPANRRKYNIKKESPVSGYATEARGEPDSDDEYDPMSQGRAKIKVKSKATTDAAASSEPHESSESSDSGEEYSREGVMDSYQSGDGGRTNEITSLQMNSYNLARFPAGVSGRRGGSNSSMDVVDTGSTRTNTASSPMNSWTAHNNKYAGVRMVDQPGTGYFRTDTGYKPQDGALVSKWAYEQAMSRNAPDGRVRSNGPVRRPMLANEYMPAAQYPRNMAIPYQIGALPGTQFNRSGHGQAVNLGHVTQENMTRGQMLSLNERHRIVYEKHTNNPMKTEHTDFDESQFLLDAFPNVPGGVKMTGQGYLTGTFRPNDSLDMSHVVGMMGGPHQESTLGRMIGPDDMPDNSLGAQGDMGAFLSDTTGQAIAPEIDPDWNSYFRNAIDHYSPGQFNEGTGHEPFMGDNGQSLQSIAGLGVDGDMSIDTDDVGFNAEDWVADNDNEASKYEQVVNQYVRSLKNQAYSEQLAQLQDEYPEV